MGATDAFELSPPTDEDLAAAHAAWRDGRLVHEIGSGARWWRIVRARSSKEALEYAKVCYPSDKNNRFTPVYAACAIVPAAYAGSTPEISLWEGVLRGIRHEGVRRVAQHEIADRYLVETRVRRSLRLVELRRPCDMNVVAPGKRPPDLTAAWPHRYPSTRKWAQELYTRLADIDGLIYESHQVPGDCIVLFQPKNPDAFMPMGEAQTVSSEPVRIILKSEAKRAGAIVDFGDLPDPHS
jgi:hypothetical protein